jgi:hypothetical protein
MAYVEQAAMMLMACRAVVGRGYFFAGFGGFLNQRMADAQNGSLSVGGCG